jgi:probable HAF family extracellular repeat protein
MAVAVIAVLLLFVTAALSPATAADYSFTALPGAPGATSTFPYGINDASQTAPTRIVGQFTSGGTIHGFQFSDGVFAAIDVPGARFTAAKGINKAGQIVGIFGLFGQGGQHGFLRDINGSFTTIDVPGMTFTEPHGINSDGHVAGWFGDAAGRGHGFLFAGGGFTAINAPGALDTLIYGINDSGQMVGNVNIFDGTKLIIHGFLLSGGIFTTFDVPGALETYATGITNAGQIVGWFRDATNHNGGFVRDTSGNFKTFDYPASLATVVHGTNNAGQIVGMFWDAQGPHGFLATPTGDCTDQVVVNDFSAQTTSGLQWLIARDTLSLATQSNPHTRYVSTGPHGPQPGIKFTADVSINDGPIPATEIHIRYIQNVTDWNGTLVYEPGPNAVASLLLEEGESLPFLDKTGQPPPAFYDTNFNETNADGSARTVTATDSPAMLGIDITLPDPTRQLQSVDVALTLTMFLGCYADQDGIFRTLSTLDWGVLYSGTLNSGSHPSFTPGPGAGITAQSSVANETLPKQTAPLFNDVATIAVDTP